jgi:hypothetical protein
MGRAAPAAGQGLGNAQGKISIDTSDLLRIQALTQQVGQTVARNLGQIDQGAKRAQQGVSGLAQTLGGLPAALGLAAGGAAIAVQLGRFALAADATATAYRRQSVAAVSLAGSQSKLNELLRTYDRVTGGVIDKAAALADVTRLQAVGFADNAAELEKFTIASRGISIAMGSSQDYIIGQLQLAIANQSTMRLDQLGLGVSEVETKIKELKAANGDLSNEMAYQNAILDLAIAKFGALAKSAEAQATGAEKAAKAWKDFQLQLGTDAGPAVSGYMGLLAQQLDAVTERLQQASRDAQFLSRNLQGIQIPGWMQAMLGAGLNVSPIGLMQSASGVLGGGGTSLEERVLRGRIRSQEGVASMASAGLARLRSEGAPQAEIDRMAGLVREANTQLAQLRAQLQGASLAAGRFANAGTSGLDLGALNRLVPNRSTATGPTYTADQTDAVQQWARDVADIERQAAQQRLETTRQYEQQRADAIRDYGKTVAREEADFARNRARALRDYNQQIADVQEQAAKQAAQAAQDYADAVADVQEDIGRREARWQADYNERIAELRQDGNERLTELEADYQKSRERAQQDHRDRLLDAAGRLDAVAVREEQRRYAREQQDAAEAHTEKISDAKDALAEQLADAQAAYAEQVAEARESDARRLADMQEAFAEQRQAAQEAEAERLADMQAAFEQRLADEDAERAIQNERRAQDYADQLAQLDQANADRMAKIAEQAAQEKKQLEQTFLEELNDLGLHNAAWLEIQKARQAESLALFNQFWDGLQSRFAVQGADTGPTWLTDFAGGRSAPVAPVAPVAGNAGGGGRGFGTVTVQSGAIVINASPAQSEQVLARMVRDELVALLEGVQ